MNTTCVLVVLAMCHTPPYIAQAMGAEATLTTHRMHLLLTADQNTWLEGQATGLRNKSAVVRDLIDTARQGLTLSATLGKPSAETAAKPEQEKVLPLNSLTTKEEKRSKDKNKAANYVFSVPPELEEVKADLLEYWREYKKGRKSRAAGGMLITGCQAILEKYGATVLKEQIQLACANNWQSITLKGYEQFGLSASKGYTPAQASEPNREYGTGRVFTADDFYGTTSNPDNPLTELF